MKTPLKLINRFFELESASGILLLFTALLAMLWANSPLAYLHDQFIDMSLFTINEGLMALFFLVVGLELKRGFLEGQLSRLSQVALPAFAAIGGMLIPAWIYWLFNYGDPITSRGWATPVATDIAFAVGILSLFGRRVPLSLKLFLLALAIFDDLGAIIIIALFYSHGFSWLWLGASFGLTFILILFNYYSVDRLSAYLGVGALLWYASLKAGIHPTLSGVIIALAIPYRTNSGHQLVNRLEAYLHPWVAYLIMPLFALANAGFSLAGLTLEILLDKVVLGITLGLFVGKQIGVMGFSWLLVRMRLAKLPVDSWLAFYGVALLCGIGFTMSLFLGTLSFQNEITYLAEVRLGVIIGSILSSIAGATVLFIAFAKEKGTQD